MKADRITTPDHPDFGWCIDLYMNSFPYEERRDRQCVESDLADNRFFFLCFKEEETGNPVGFFTYWEMGEFLYGEHFAVDPSRRGGGLGAGILAYVLSIGIPVILEVEKPDTAIALHRIDFYRRNGFVLNGHLHFQPPYHKDCQPLEMKIMTYPETFSSEKYEDFKERQLAIVPHFLA